MNKTFQWIIILMVVMMVGGGNGPLQAGEKDVAVSQGEPAKTSHEAHKAPHGGFLNEIEACGIGHAEVKVSDAILELWLLDGGSETGRSVTSPDLGIHLSLVTPKKERLELFLKAEPMLLAGEKVGTCSHFSGTNDGLKGLPSFEGYGWIQFKGTMRPLRISYPKGFEGDECDHDHPHDHEKGPAGK